MTAVSALPEVSGVAGCAPRCRSVIMAGTALDGIGGIRAVVQGYIEGGLMRRVPCVYVVTHCYGSRARKACAALSGWWRVWRLLGRLPAPLLHVHLASRASFWRKSVLCLMARMRGRPYLLHLHGGEFMTFYFSECGPLARRFVSGIFLRASAVIALSEAWRARIARIAPGARVEVIPNGVTVPARAAAGRGGAAPRILFLGELTRMKGAFDLVAAFAQLASRQPEAILVCAGAGDRDALAATCPAELRGRLELPGWLDAAQKARELGRATLFVLPSHAEGLPMSVLEAMACGLPVITTPVGGLPQLIEPDVNGLLVPPARPEALAAALDRALRDPQLCERLGRAARGTIESAYSLERSLARLTALYRRFGIDCALPQE